MKAVISVIFNKSTHNLTAPVAVDESIEGKAIRPAAGEVDHIDVSVVFSGLPDPT